MYRTVVIERCVSYVRYRRVMCSCITGEGFMKVTIERCVSYGRYREVCVSYGRYREVCIIRSL